MKIISKIIFKIKINKLKNIKKILIYNKHKIKTIKAKFNVIKIINMKEIKRKIKKLIKIKFKKI